MMESDNYLLIESSITVSVIIPVYNVGGYLSQCLESVTHQTYKRLQIILVDDGSTDDSGKICDDYSQYDDRIQVIHFCENRGLAAARNEGLKSVKGQYISFIDSDDWVEPHAIETLLKASLFYNADITVANRLKEYINYSSHMESKCDSIRVSVGEEIIHAYLDKAFDDVIWNKLFSISSFKNIRFPEGHNYEDIFVTWKIIKSLADNNGRLVIIPNELYHFRMRKSSICHTKSLDNTIDYWEAHLLRFESLPEYKSCLLQACFDAIGRMWFNYFTFIKQDKNMTISTVEEMQAFSRNHFWLCIKGNYTGMTKMISFISLIKSPILIRFCSCLGFIRRLFKTNKMELFD